VAGNALAEIILRQPATDVALIAIRLILSLNYVS
jgi:hypothetical protein